MRATRFFTPREAVTCEDWPGRDVGAAWAGEGASIREEGIQEVLPLKPCLAPTCPWGRRGMCGVKAQVSQWLSYRLPGGWVPGVHLAEFPRPSSLRQQVCVGGQETEGFMVRCPGPGRVHSGRSGAGQDGHSDPALTSGFICPLPQTPPHPGHLVQSRCLSDPSILSRLGTGARLAGAGAGHRGEAWASKISLVGPRAREGGWRSFWKRPQAVHSSPGRGRAGAVPGWPPPDVSQ